MVNRYISGSWRFSEPEQVRQPVLENKAVVLITAQMSDLGKRPEPPNDARQIVGGFPEPAPVFDITTCAAMLKWKKILKKLLVSHRAL